MEVVVEWQWQWQRQPITCRHAEQPRTTTFDRCAAPPPPLTAATPPAPPPSPGPISRPSVPRNTPSATAASGVPPGAATEKAAAAIVPLTRIGPPYDVRLTSVSAAAILVWLTVRSPQPIPPNSG